MDVLIYGKSSDNALGKMCARGLENLSHNVHYFTPELTTIPFLGAINVEEIRSAFYETVLAESPDVVLVIKGYELGPSIISKIRSETDAVVINWNPDNPYQVRSTPKKAKKYLKSVQEYHIVFTWGEFLVKKLGSIEAADVRYLPFAHDPTIHRPVDSKPNYDCEVIFLGHYSKKRERILSSLTDFDLQIWGNMWKYKCRSWKLRKHHKGDAIGGQEYSRAMSSADIVINVVADHNSPAHNMRTFEVPPTGTLMVTTRTDGQRKLFSEGTETVMYDDGDELRQKVSYYLKNESEREQIEEQSKETVQEHTYQNRMKTVIQSAKEYC